MKTGGNRTCDLPEGDQRGLGNVLHHDKHGRHDSWTSVPFHFLDSLEASA